VRRELIKIAEDMLNGAYEAPIDCAPENQIQHAEQLLYEIAEMGRYGGGFETFETALDNAIDRAAQAYQSDGRLSGLATGLKDLDAKMGGLQPTDLIIIAGRPGMGKTSLATNIAFNVASAYDATQQVDGSVRPVAGGIVAFFSLEMSSEQLATRVISEQTEIPSSDIRRGEIDETDFGKLLDCRQEMRRLPLFIDQTGAVSIAQLAARARRLKRQRGLHLIIVDYIQLMQGKSPRAAQNRVQEITEITTGLKRWLKNSMCQSLRCRNFHAWLKAATKNARNSRIFANQVRLNKTPTSYCLCFARSTISKTRSPGLARTITSVGKPR
jgi:replicative DNA helicase